MVHRPLKSLFLERLVKLDVDPLILVLDRSVIYQVPMRDATEGRSRDQGKRFRSSDKWISTVTRVDFTVLELIVHALRLCYAYDASKIVAVKLCGSPFSIGM